MTGPPTLSASTTGRHVSPSKLPARIQNRDIDDRDRPARPEYYKYSKFLDQHRAAMQSFFQRPDQWGIPRGIEGRLTDRGILELQVKNRLVLGGATARTWTSFVEASAVKGVLLDMTDNYWVIRARPSSGADNTMGISYFNMHYENDIVTFIKSIIDAHWPQLAQISVKLPYVSGGIKDRIEGYIGEKKLKITCTMVSI